MTGREIGYGNKGSSIQGEGTGNQDQKFLKRGSHQKNPGQGK
jgi:hypothetical protein